MMGLSLKLCLSLFLGAFFITGCGDTPIPAIFHKCQAVIVVDKTNSVSFTIRLPKLQGELRGDLECIYATATRDIQCSRLLITGQTGVFPDRDYFREKYPEGDEDSRIYQQALQRWNIDKRKWISDEVTQADSLIRSPCSSNSTDIFSIFGGIREVQNTDGPWDTVKALIFSDMVNTTHELNMISQVTDGNASEKGKGECKHMIDEGKLSRENINKLYLTIYTPDNMPNTNRVNQFWTGFFEEWGLGKDHYHFE